MLVGTISLVVAIALPTALAAAFNSSAAVLEFDGSTTVYPVVQVALTRFPVDFPDVTSMTATATGSGHGQAEILAGVPDLGMSSSACATSNGGTNGQPAAIYDCPGGSNNALPNKLVDTVFAKDAVTVIANHHFISTTCGVADSSAILTKVQLQQIYQGVVTDWHTLFSGCPSGTTIVPIARIIGSGTRSSFLKLAGINCDASDPDDAAGNCSPTANSTGGSTENATITATGVARIDANSDVESYVDTHPGSISYIGLAFTDANNIQFGLNFTGTAVFPSTATVLNTTYPMSRNLHFFSAPQAAAPNGNPKQRVQDFLTWILSPEGQGIVNDVGYVAIATAKPDFDVNGDHNCNVLDLVSIGGAWNATAPASGNPAYPLIRGWIAQDANYDGHVNVLDLVTVGTHWGTGSW